MQQRIGHLFAYLAVLIAMSLALVGLIIGTAFVIAAAVALCPDIKKPSNNADFPWKGVALKEGYTGVKYDK